MNKFLLDQQAGQLHGNIKTQTITVSGGPTLIPAEPLAGRKDFLLYNNTGNDTIFVGGSNVTSDDGIPVLAGGSFGAQLGRSEVWAIVSGTNQTVRVMEIA